MRKLSIDYDCILIDFNLVAIGTCLCLVSTPDFIMFQWLQSAFLRHVDSNAVGLRRIFLFLVRHSSYLT